MAQFSGHPGTRRLHVPAVHAVVFGRERCEGEAVGGDDLGSDPLPDAACVLAVDQQGSIGVRVDVDEAGRDV